MSLPTFLVLGAARSGTTSLHYYLRHHPQVCMSAIKEPNFFLFDHRRADRPPLIADDRRLLAKSVRDPKKYEQLFRAADERTRAIGEASPLYLFTAETPLVIREVLGEVRLVAILRDPVARAYSHFHSLDPGPEDGSLARFEAAVDEEAGEPYSPYRIGTHVLRLGRYGEQLARYRDVFDEGSIHVEFFEELRQDPGARLGAICDFVGVDPQPVTTWDSYNGSGTSTTAAPLRSVLRAAQPWVKGALPPRLVGRLAEVRARRLTPAPSPKLPGELRGRLQDYYARDVEHLETLLGRPVPASWRT